jgi:hypothetical protein
MLMVAVLLSACATNPKVNGVADQPRFVTPSIESKSFMYRSPPPAALRGAGLAR